MPDFLKKKPIFQLFIVVFFLSVEYRAGIPAVNKNGDLLLLYLGVIDILQNYRLRKKLEHAFKSTLVTRVCRIFTSTEKNNIYLYIGRNICL